MSLFVARYTAPEMVPSCGAFAICCATEELARVASRNITATKLTRGRRKLRFRIPLDWFIMYMALPSCMVPQPDPHGEVAEAAHHIVSQVPIDPSVEENIRERQATDVKDEQHQRKHNGASDVGPNRSPGVPHQRN